MTILRNVRCLALQCKYLKKRRDTQNKLHVSLSFKHLDRFDRICLCIRNLNSVKKRSGNDCYVINAQSTIQISIEILIHRFMSFLNLDIIRIHPIVTINANQMVSSVSFVHLWGKQYQHMNVIVKYSSYNNKYYWKIFAYVLH